MPGLAIPAVGPRLAIVTNGGGPGVLAADWIAEHGLELCRLAPEAAAALAPQLAPLTTLGELLDLSQQAGPEHFRAAVAACCSDSSIDGGLAIYSPKLGDDPGAVAQALSGLSPSLGKPLLCCWMGEGLVAEGRRVLNGAGIASFRTPEAAVEAFSNIATFYHNQLLLRQTPPPLSPLAAPGRAWASAYAVDHGSGARQRPARNRRLGACQQRGHAAADAPARLRVGQLPAGSGLHAVQHGAIAGPGVWRARHAEQVVARDLELALQR